MFDTYNVQLTREPSPMLVEGLRACIRPESASKFRQVFATCRDLETLEESCYFDFISVARVEPIRNRRGRILLIQASKQGPKLTQIFLKPPLGIVLSVRPFNCRPEGGRHAVTLNRVLEGPESSEPLYRTDCIRGRAGNPRCGSTVHLVTNLDFDFQAHCFVVRGFR